MKPPAVTAEMLQALYSSRSLFSSINEGFWSQHEDKVPEWNGKYILVDFMVSHNGYLIGNAIIAKYLQFLHGCKPLVLIPDRQYQWIVDVAKSYGFTEFIYENEGEKLPGDLFNQLPFRQAQSPSHLRNMILNTDLGGTKAGEYIYDSYLMGVTPGTIQEITPELEKSVLAAIYYQSFYSKLFEQYDFEAVVAGHRVYNRFGIMCQIAINKEIPVYGRKQHSFPAFTVRRDDTLESLGNYEYDFDLNEFERALEIATPDIIEEAKELVLNGFNGGLMHEAHNNNRRTLNREELCNELNLDPDKPIVCIFSHVFSDAPHFCRGVLYDDYLHWLIATLKIIRKNPNVNWILKAHPLQKEYKCTLTAQDIYHQYAADIPQLTLAPDDHHIHTFYHNADAVVTCAGSAGLEFPCMGVPAIIASKSFYADRGFTVESDSIDAYEQKLLNITDYFSFSQRQQHRALVYWYLVFKFSHIASDFLPEIHCCALSPNEEVQKWFEAAQLLKNKDPFADPFFTAFKEQVKNKTKHPYPPGFWTPGMKDEAA